MELLGASKWDTVMASQVVAPGNISGLEGDAAVLAARRALRPSRNLGAMLVLIVDNLPLCLWAYARVAPSLVIHVLPFARRAASRSPPGLALQPAGALQS